MPYNKGDEIIPGYIVENYFPEGPLSELYVVRDTTNMLFDLEILPSSLTSKRAIQIAYRSLLFIAGVKHPCLPKSQGTITLSFPSGEQMSDSQEVVLWEHSTGQLPLQELVETIGPLHPAQAVEIILDVCTALLSANKMSRNSIGNAFPHLSLSPQTIALKENRIPIILGWANRAAFLTPIETITKKFHNRYAPYSDPLKPGKDEIDTRHDVYALVACLFFLIKGSPPSFNSYISETNHACLIKTFEPVLGEKLTKLLLKGLNPSLFSRPSIELLTRDLAAVQSELETFDFGNWNVCSVCGLMMKKDVDLCPLCIRDRILPTKQISPSALTYSKIPPTLQLPHYGEFTSLEELATVLPEIVFDSVNDSEQIKFELLLRKMLFYLIESGYREFVGDLLQEDGSLTEKPYWIASELAHRISPRAAEMVELFHEKASFLRWLRGREKFFLFKKTLLLNKDFNGFLIDFVFRGRFYIFSTKPDFNLWDNIKKILDTFKKPVVLVVLRKKPPAVPRYIADSVTVYYGFPHKKIGKTKIWGTFDEYRFFSFVRGFDKS